MAEVRTTISQYTINAATDGPEADLWEIQVDRAPQMDGTVLWAVRRRHRCLNRRGVWDLEPSPSSRTDRWLKGHRFPLDEAMRIALKAAPDVTVNGLKAKDVTP